jgi:hypothetical protein
MSGAASAGFDGGLELDPDVSKTVLSRRCDAID